MPSRKRTKGRERKLKQQAREPVERSVSQPTPNGENTNLPEQSIRRIEQAKNVECRHGGFESPQGYPESDFIGSFIDDALTPENFNTTNMLDFMKMKFVEYQEVWKDDAVRKTDINTIVCLGTDSIIRDRIEYARLMCIAIVSLEKHTGKGPFDSALSKATEDLTYLLDAEEREIVRFYKKRIPCSCLDKLYSEIKKSQIRGSRCFHCEQTVKRKDLKACIRCKHAQYCSKECQVADWPSHKECCMAMADLHKECEKGKNYKKE